MNHSPEDALTLGDSDDEQPVKVGTHTELTRSTSPAKRRASAMEDGVEKVGDDQPRSLLRKELEQDGLDSQHPSSSGKQPSSGGPVKAATDGTVNATSSSNATRSLEHAGTTDAPSINNDPTIDQQVETIQMEVMKPLEDGMAGFVVSASWISRVFARSSQKEQHGPYEKDVLEGDIGPLDNHSVMLEQAYSGNLTNEHGEHFIPLRPGLQFGIDAEILPEPAFELVKNWYGLANGQTPIKRYAHANNPDGEDKNVQWEMYPPTFVLRKLKPERGSLDKRNVEDAAATAPRIVCSRNGLFQKFLRRAKEATGIPMDSKVKLWRVLNPQSVATEDNVKATNEKLLLSPPQSRDPSPAGQTKASSPLIIKSEVFKAMPEGSGREMIDMKDETNNDKYNGSTDLATLGLGADQILILEEQGNNGFASDSVRKGQKTGSTGNAQKGGLLSNTNGSRASPALGPMTRGRNRTSARTQGSVGLTNLGNTCYMNSALQCLRATEELTCFFLSKQWAEELNSDNPLGYNGKMASTYAGLLQSIYNTNGSAVTPNDFKRVLGRSGPQFSGYGQQDSQEFMSFLVDALHEDMNRIHKKPYIENPDSDDAHVHDPNYVKDLGETFRNNYKKRNNSVIVDLFSGFYKNTMVCPECDKVSVTFDPYSLLTLQLPLEHSWQHTIFYIPLIGRSLRIEIDMDKHSTIRQLKEYVASKFKHANAKRMMMVEIFSRKFYRTVEDKQTIAECNIQQRDDMYLYELEEVPTNFPPPKRKKNSRSYLSIADSEEDDIPGPATPLGQKMTEQMMVPVFQRAYSSPHGPSRSLVLIPFFITLNHQDACSYTEIYRKILARIASLSTRDFLSEQDSGDAASDTDESQERPVMTTEDDASSTLDPSVQARSIDSEDGVVDITMSNDESAVGDSASTREAAPGFPSVLRRGHPIPASMSSLFELKYMEASTDIVPTGYSNIDNGRNYKTIKSRLPRLVRRPSVTSTNDATPSSSEESSDADELSNSIQQSHDGAASDSEGLRTSGKEAKKPEAQRYADTSDDQSAEYETESQEALINLGECIVLDWERDAYDALFGGRGEDDLRGREAFGKQGQLLEDVELVEKRRKRVERKKTGITLDECFKVTSRGEILTEENAWYCNSCKELRQAEKTLEIWTAPDILVIHLKRFSAQRQFRDKIDILIDFPVEGLDLNDKVGMTEGKDLTYDLFGVDNHYGGLGGGHYTAYAKNFLDGQWYEYNDSSVSKRQASSVVSSSAYLLFYRRRSSSYLGPPDLRQLVHEFRNPVEAEEVEDSQAEEEELESSGQGKGHRLDESYHSGSSNALPAAGAGRQQRRGGDGSAAAAAHEDLLQNGRGDQVEHLEHTEVDGYDAELEDEDSADNPLQFGPQRSNAYGAADSWHWPGSLATLGNGHSANDEDTDADADDAGSNDAQLDLSDRMIDFEDEGLGGEMSFDSRHQTSPILTSTERDDYLMSDVQPLTSDHRMDLMEDDAIEIRLGDEDDAMPNLE